MWLSLLFVALAFAITMAQGRQGLFSAFITTVLTICCAATAFGTYEWVAIQWLAPYWKPDYALPIALGAIFGVPLVLLRLAFDRLIRRACLLPAWLDRVGGGVCGLVTAMMMVGVVGVCVQMIPFADGSILGYSRFAVANQEAQRAPGATAPDPNVEERELWLTPDRFVAGIAFVLADGIFSGKEGFYKHNPDLVQTIGWVGAAHHEVSRYAAPGSISIVRTRPVPVVYRMTPDTSREGGSPQFEEQPPNAGKRFQMVRVRLRAEARDLRRSHIFTLRQFRLVGQDEEGGAYRQCYPIAIQQEEGDVPNRHVRYKKRAGQFWPVIDERLSPRAGNNDEVEVVFELPVGFKPAFLEYKREARVTVSFDRTASGGRDSERAERPSSPGADRAAPSRTPAEQPTTVTSSETPRTAETAPGGRRRRRGNVRTVTTGSGGSRFSEDMPLTMRSYQQLNNVEISRGALVSGHLLGEVGQQADGTNQAVSKFRVPRDKRLLQLNVQRLRSGSAFGQALSLAIATVQNYTVMDEGGNRYLVAGKYAVASVRGRKIVEVQYFSEPVGSIGGMGKFRRIDEKNLKADDEFILLFLVDPGVRIVSFSTGGSASRQDDLTSENLIAPP